MKLDGKPLDIRKLAASKESLIRMLDGAPTDEIFSNVELAKKFGVDSSCINKYAKDLQDYTVTLATARYWGNPKAIRELDKQLKAVR